MKRERIVYLVREKGHISERLYVGANVEDCKIYIQNELRNRNKNDKYDEYWHTVELEIVKQVVTEEIVAEVK